jgi:hypothetical protein
LLRRAFFAYHHASLLKMRFALESNLEHRLIAICAVTVIFQE